MLVNIDNKEQLFSYFQSLPVAVVVVETHNSEIVFFSEEAELLWGRSAHEVVGKKQTVLHPKQWNEINKERFLHDISTLHKQKTVNNTQSIILRGDNSEIPVDIYAKLLEVEGIEYIIGVFVSIEKRTRAYDILQKKHNALEHLLENIAGISWEYDYIHDKFTYISKNIYTILGYQPHEMHKIRDWYNTIHPQDKKRVLLHTTKHTQRGKNHSIEYRIKKEDGTYIWVLEIVNIKKAIDGTVLQTYGVLVDITEQKEAQNALKKEKEFISSVIDAINDSIMVIDMDYSVRLMNKKAKDALKQRGIDAQTAALKCYDVFHSPEDQCGEEGHRCPMNAVLTTKKVVKVVHKHYDKDNKERFIEISATPLFNEAGEIISIIEIGHDITEHLNLVKELEKNTALLDFKAHHDELTSLPNRTLYRDRIEMAIKKSKRSEEKFALLFLDLDHFKEVNDSLGHAAGDRVLLEASRRLLSLIRQEDTLARLGGDEFTILLENIHNIKDVTQMARKILDAFKAPFEIDEKRLYLGCSIGISIYPDDGDNAEDLLKYADNAMYKAKENGRNSFEFYTKSMTELANKRIELEREIRRALQNDEFELYYQPQIDALSYEVVGVEALIRWNSKEKGIIAPSEFIPFAESSNLIIEIDNWVMKKALKDLHSLQSKKLFCGKLSLNLATRQLENRAFIPFVKKMLKQYKVDARYLQLEILERDLMRNPKKNIRTLQELQKIGISIALDDFGTGYSSLTYLHEFPIDELKLDKSFIDAAIDNKPEIALAVIALAKALKLRIVAEGVESKKGLDFVVGHGCSIIQGYYFSKPLPFQAFEDFLQRGVL
jgi:diguanylate cyclase (GGDEF)-like protein/PAS domain S-box-containing protein